MKEEEIKIVAENAMMIVCGYAFSKTEEGLIRVVYWKRNKKLMEQAYA